MIGVLMGKQYSAQAEPGGLFFIYNFKKALLLVRGGRAGINEVGGISAHQIRVRVRAGGQSESP
jgi:hypothetical protein